MPLAELQAQWVADLVSGVGTLLPGDEMRAEIRDYHARLRRRQVASQRHTIQVDSHAYATEITRERKAGRHRAAAGCT